MEFLTLRSDFQPDKVVENYQSIIWTERYAKNGEFQLTSYNITETLNLLMPEDPDEERYVSLRETTVPMMVEVFKIEKKPDGALLTVKGRSFENCALERRGSVNALVPGVQRVAWTISAAKESDAAYEAMRSVLGDEPRYNNGAMVLPLVPPSVAPEDAIPEIDLTLPFDYGVVIWDATITYPVGEVVYYSNVFYVSITNVAANLNKIPSSQPTFWTAMAVPTAWSSSVTYPPKSMVYYSGSLYIASGAGNLNKIPSSQPTFWTAAVAGITYSIEPGELYATVMGLINTNHHGIKSVRPGPLDSKVGIEIYNGADLRDELVFDARFDQFDSTSYLLSSMGSKNVAYIYGSNGADKVLKTSAPEPSGMARRVLVLDASSDATMNTSPIRSSRALIELYNYNATAMFDGEVAIQIADLYNKADGYFLGDILKLTGEYGLSQDVRVAEFIRTSDSNGDRAYPTLEAIS